MAKSNKKVKKGVGVQGKAALTDKKKGGACIDQVSVEL